MFENQVLKSISVAWERDATFRNLPRKSKVLSQLCLDDLLKNCLLFKTFCMCQKNDS